MAAHVSPLTTHSVLYYDRAFGGEVRRVPQGGCVIARDGEVLATLLGSCVAVCLRDTESGIGGMNHFLMPAPDGELTPHPAHSEHPYGEEAMSFLIDSLLRLGARREHLQAKVFGGAEMVPILEGVGLRNADCALGFLTAHSVPLAAQDLGGTASRRVYFQPQSGRVWVRMRRRKP